MSVVDGDPEVQPLLECLLGSVYIVDDLVMATDCWKKIGSLRQFCDPAWET